MPAFILAFLGALMRMAPTLIGRVLIALGFQLVTITGLTLSLDWATAYVTSHWAGLPAISLQLLSALRVGTDIGILVGAILARLSLNGLQSGALSFMAMRARIG